MKKLVLFIWLAFTGYIWSAPGDTILVRTHDNVLIMTDPSYGYTLYPSWAQFPDSTVSIHKILLKLNLGCRQGAGMHCGEWDYLNHIWLRHKGGVNDTTLYNYEIARYVTPYGYGFASSWKGEWILDITEWEPFLHDSVEIVYNHSGYESNSDRGWTVTLDFIMIEGTPVHDFNGFHQLWSGWFPYGQSGNPIDNYLQQDTLMLSNGSQHAILWMNQTGHGMDTPDNCAEFCPKTRTLKYDGSTFDTKDIWRESCGENPLYPQFGTWVYDRTQWCPGSTVHPDKYTLNVNSGQHTFDADMQAYTSTGSTGNYVFQTYLFEYKAPNFTTDAAIVDIVSPNTRFEYNRLNPICDDPVIVIQNTGSTPLTSLTIEYGVQGGPVTVYNWTGNLAFNATEQVSLTNPVNWTSGNGTFQVELKNPNGLTDEYTFNNKMTTSFTQPVSAPNDIYIYFKTNLFPNETSWYLHDAAGTLIASRSSGLTANTLYKDTLSLTDGCYTFDVIDNDGDGLSFWANSDGSGIINIRKASNGAPVKTFGADFGGELHFQFTVGGYMSTEEETYTPDLELYPNPTTGDIYIAYPFSEESSYALMDMSGKVLLRGMAGNNNGLLHLYLGNQPKGMYLVQIQSGNQLFNKKVVLN